MHYIIMCRSLTCAQRTAKTLERAGMPAYVLRPPAAMSENGCSYGVKIRERYFSAALDIMSRMPLKHGKIYSVQKDGSFGEVRL